VVFRNRAWSGIEKVAREGEREVSMEKRMGYKIKRIKRHMQNKATTFEDVGVGALSSCDGG
jgi:hypothetical protein